MIKNKKGFVGDIFVFMLVAFILSLMAGIFLYLGYAALDELHDHTDIIQKAIGSKDNATTVINDTFGKVPNAYESLKWITVMLIVGMFLSILITYFLVRTRPVFFIAYLLVWIIAIIVSVPLSNAYEIVYQTPVLASSFTGFYGQTYIMLHFPIWVTIIGGLAGIILFVNLIKQSQYGGYI